MQQLNDLHPRLHGTTRLAGFASHVQCTWGYSSLLPYVSLAQMAQSYPPIYCADESATISMCSLSPYFVPNGREFYPHAAWSLIAECHQ